MSDVKVTRLTPTHEARIRGVIADLGEQAADGAFSNVFVLMNEIDALRAELEQTKGPEFTRRVEKVTADMDARLAQARSEGAAEERAARDACEVCGDVLEPAKPRCINHCHVEPGDDVRINGEWVVWQGPDR